MVAVLPCNPAWSLQSPQAQVVLTVSGRIQHGNAGRQRERADFDMAMLSALPQAQFETRTPWFARARKFAGPLLRDVLRAAGANGETLRLRALNDYRVDMPMQDTRNYDVMAALLMDGKPMAVRDKGPLLVIYPFDARSELRRTVFYARSAWQLRSIEVM